MLYIPKFQRFIGSEGFPLIQGQAESPPMPLRTTPPSPFCVWRRPHTHGPASDRASGPLPKVHLPADSGPAGAGAAKITTRTGRWAGVKGRVRSSS
jgi:hypothetical protein